MENGIVFDFMILTIFTDPIQLFVVFNTKMRKFELCYRT